MLCFRIHLILVLFLLIGCTGRGNFLIVGSISGPDEVAEGTTVEYSVEAGGDSGITYSWVVNPVGYGSMDPLDASSTTFTASEVDADFEIEIVVVVNSDNDGPVVRSMDVTVKDVADPPDPPVNQPPTAAAHASTYDTEPGMEIQFYNDSTDPDGDDDIVKWEWDFSYDPDDGFIVENIEIEPLVEFSEFGIYFIQLRVTDSMDQFDILDEPLQINVLPDHPYASYGFTFGGERSHEYARGIGVDPQGNVYVAGRIGNKCIDVEPGDGIYEIYPDGYSAYIIKYGQPDFNVIDVAWWEVSSFKKFTGDRNGNFFISGEYTGESHYYYREGGAFIWSITPTNLNNWRFQRDNYYWYSWWYGEVTYFEKYYFSPVACDNNGNIFFTESVWISDYDYGDSLDFNIYKGSTSTDPDLFLNLGSYILPTSIQTSFGAGSHGFLVLSYVSEHLSELAHFSLDGTLHWEIQITHKPYTLYTPILSDADGNYYILQVNDNDVTCISPDGDFIWELQWDAVASDIYVYDDGSFLVTGTFKDTVDFDPGPKEAFMLSPGRWSGYISVFDSNGNFQWVETWGYSTSMSVSGITVDHLGNIYVCGSFSKSIDLGPSWESDIHYSDDWSDAFVLKLSQ